jgi:hypothetical protein
VGSSPHSPAWFIFNLATHRSIGSGSVVFDERIYILSKLAYNMQDTREVLHLQEATDLASTLYDGRRMELCKRTTSRHHIHLMTLEISDEKIVICWTLCDSGTSSPSGNNIAKPTRH